MPHRAKFTPSTRHARSSRILCQPISKNSVALRSRHPKCQAEKKRVRTQLVFFLRMALP